MTAAASSPSASAFKTRIFAVGVLLLVWSIYSAIGTWQKTHAVMINASESLPHWAFFVEQSNTPKHGDIVFFTPPPHPLVKAHFGENPSAFGKQVFGMPGDVVSHRGADVLVNGKVVGRMKPLTRAGEKLTAGPVGTIPSNCFYLGTSHPDGFDSRYAEIGFVCRRQIAGIGTAIL